MIYGWITDGNRNLRIIERQRLSVINNSVRGLNSVKYYLSIERSTEDKEISFRHNGPVYGKRCF